MNTDDPYSIIGIDPYLYFSKDDLKTQYKLKAREHHPDKGGDKIMFDRIQKAYTYIYREMRPIWFSTEKNFENELSSRDEPIQTNFVDEFDITVFNTEYERFKLPTEYDVTMTDYVDQEIVTINNEDNFNLEFDTHIANMQSSDSIVQIKEPKTIDTIYQPQQTILGRTQIEDFTTHKSTDFHKAFTKYNTISQNINKTVITPQLVSTESAREYRRIDLSQTAGDILYHQQQENHKQLLERQRQINLFNQDQVINQRYQQIQNRIQYN